MMVHNEEPRGESQRFLKHMGTSLLMQPAVGPAKHMADILMGADTQVSHGKPLCLLHRTYLSMIQQCQTVLSWWAVLLKQALRSRTESHPRLKRMGFLSKLFRSMAAP